MATRSGRPPNGSAARLPKTSGSRSSIPSQAFVVTLAAVAAAAVISIGRFHENTDAKVAPCAQFLRDETIGMGADAAHRVAFGHSGFTTRNVSAQTELVTQRGHDLCNASSAGSFTASSSSTNSSSIAAPDFITRGCTATFDKGLISPSSKALQRRSADEEIEKIEGGGDRRLQPARYEVEIAHLPLHVERGGDCVLHALSHGGPLLHALSHGGLLLRALSHGGLLLRALSHGGPRLLLHALLLPLLRSGPIGEGGGRIVLLHGVCVREVLPPLHAELIDE